MRAEDVALCAAAGADILGFVVEYPRPVPWNLSRAEAKILREQVPPDKKVCVVTGGDSEKIRALAAFLTPDFVQLHGGESVETTQRVADALAGRGVGVIKTLFPDTKNLVETAKAFAAAGVYALLFDPRTPDNAAQGGRADLAAFAALRAAVRCPVILAGGINPENAAAIIAGAAPEIIDLMTGVEAAPGVKSREKVAALFGAVRGA
jgi:phosphoribosylanthranilate isomerase